MQFTLSEIDTVAASIIAQYNNIKFALYGDLGAGKTTLVSALCKQIGVQEITSSPTFAIIQEYVGCVNNKQIAVAHMDWYRLQSMHDLHSAGVLHYLHNQNTYCFIEWPNTVPEAITDQILRMYLSVVDEHTRLLEIK